jgi:S-(hydroxymethyl)glutathione dehydrogenase/alcohol dehydrogenase
MKVRAAVAERAGAPITIEELELAPPRRGEVRVRMHAAAVCQSDVHIVDGWMPEPFPMVLGHEGAGVVEELGPDVARLRVGDHVVLTIAPSCGVCDYCLQGRPNLCVVAWSVGGTGGLFDGTSRFSRGGTPIHQFSFTSSFAEAVVVPEAAAVAIPPNVPFDVAALFGCAVVTGVGAVFNTARLPAGSSVAVIGCGGVGLSAIQGARIAGARRIVAVDLRAAKLERAQRAGATDTVTAPAAEAAAAIKELTSGGVEYAFEAVGSPETIRAAWDALRPGGTVVVVGLTRSDAEVALPAFEFVHEKRILGCYYGSARPGLDIPRLIDLYLDGRLRPEVALDRAIELDAIEDAFARMRSGEAGRTIIRLAGI